MRQTVIVSALTAVVTVILSVVVLNQLGPVTVSSATSQGISSSSNVPSSEDDGQIQGDTDCDKDVDAIDALGVLVNVAALDALGQQEPCTDIANLIPVGEGIPGPQGPPGPAGPQGPAGAQGAPGISDVEEVTERTPVNSTNFKSQFAICPPGKTVVGGGAFVLEGGLFGDVTLASSAPTEALDGWSAMAAETNATNVNWSLSARAICANVAE